MHKPPLAPLKALTIWQPWASLIILGAKPDEFRYRDYRARNPAVEGQRVVIHAAKRPMRMVEVVDLVERLSQSEETAETTGLERLKALAVLDEWRREMMAGKQPLPLSHGLGTVLLGEPHKAPDLIRPMASHDGAKVLWAWPCDDPQPFEPPVPAQGYQGFWNWPHEVPA